MRFDVVTLFPEMFNAITAFGVTGRAFKQGLVEAHFHNPRDYSETAYGSVDDRSYGGGPGQVMQVAPLRKAIKAAQGDKPRARVIYLSPQGPRLTQTKIEALLKCSRLVLLAGRYEGIDNRVLEHDVDEELSLGDFVLSGGECAAMCLMDGIIRLLPGVLGSDESAVVESFTQGLLDHPHYTRPETIDGQSVPPVLLTGDHAQVARWRLQQRLWLTYHKRPDLFAQYAMSKEEQQLLEDFLKQRGENIALCRGAS